ncbi:uncharacterized protein TNCT_629401 [Trichonephila clavata]|uniref:Integrase zinc-binding domain-containing protein n=1 Tax=Trichonephila clavata TaxID=2740835 RepID=A0A8X6G7W2_TRICU|nr:uncharacterized protein TNCT_629401 [Trichonephila clavata]
MQLRKWSSNCIELLSNFDVSDGDVFLTIPDETKALGLMWRPQKDTLAFSVFSIADVSDSLHKGVESTIANIRSEFWIINCRNQVRKVLKKCISCLKINAKAKNQVMADLPSNRVNVSNHQGWY